MFFEILDQSGLSLTDTIGFEGGILINGFASVISLQLMSGKSHQLTELVGRFSSLMHELEVTGVENEKLASGIKKWTLFLFVLG